MTANWDEPLQGPLLQKRRERWLEKFKAAQAHSPRWVFLDRIVDWYVREPRTGKTDTTRLKSAYKELTQSLLMREFDHGRGGFVHVLSPENFYRLPLEKLRAPIDQGNLRGLARSYPINGDMDQTKGTILIDAYLKWCCVPADLAVHWLRNRRVDLPDWLGSNSTESAQASDAAPSKKPSRSGRRPIYDWDQVHLVIMNRLNADGVPDAGDGGQAKLEKLAVGSFPLDKCPTESVIREHVVKMMEEYRKSLA